MNSQNILSEKLKTNSVVLGTWNLINDPTVIEIFALANFDFIIIDMEHGTHSFSEASNLIRAAESRGIIPLLRPQGVDESSILRALDCGAHGLMVPNINSLEQVEKLIMYSYYPPLGSRGHSPFTRCGNFDYLNCSDRMKELNKNLFLGILIEGSDGINSLEKILVKFSNYLNVIYVGLYDLAKTIGCPGDVKNNKVSKCIYDISKLCNQNGISVGIVINDDEMFQTAIKSEVKFICYQNDTGILFEAAKKLSQKYKNITNS